MSNDKKTPASLVSSLRPQKSERELIIDVARAVDSFREAQERHNAMTYSTLQRQGTSLEQLHLVVAELSGHVARADATARQASSHDLTQDQRIDELEKGWGRVVQIAVAVYEDRRTRAIVRAMYLAAAAYLAAKGFQVLP